MLAVQFYDVILWVHITAVVTAFGGLFAYPVFLAVNARAALPQRAQLHRLQIAYSKTITGPVIGLILLAGIYLAAKAHDFGEFYVQWAFVAILVIAGLGATVLRKGEEGMLAASEAGDEAGYAATLKRTQTWTYFVLALIVLTIYVMTAKPFL